jgi:hypothetical protein
MPRHKECYVETTYSNTNNTFRILCNRSVSNSVTELFCGQFSSEEEEEEDEDEDENHAPGVLREEFILPL